MTGTPVSSAGTPPPASPAAVTNAVPQLGDPELTAALRRALSTTPPDQFVDAPSLLRSRLVTETGERAESLRGQIHLLVAAADERLPHVLAAAAPVDSHQLERLAQALAVTRGWSAAAAGQTVGMWADAMGVRAPVDPPDPAGQSGRAVDWQQPATSLPVTGFPAPPAAIGGPAVVALGAGPDRELLPWPRSNGRLLRKATDLEETTPAGVYSAFHPRSPVILLGAGAALLVAMALVFLLTHVLLGALPLALCALLTRRLIPEGRLVVDESGGRFYRKLTAGAAPLATFTWATTAVTPGLSARIATPEGPVWCSVWTKKVAAAAHSRSMTAGLGSHES
jgi:hypothetical protein